jgi:hypothetical protein
MKMARKRYLRNSINVGKRFNPKTDVGSGTLLFWIESNNLIYKDAAKTTPVSAEGDGVSVWGDLSGNGHDVVQTSGVSKPLYIPNVMGSTSGVQFDGINDFLTSTSFDSTIGQSGYTLFISAATNDTGVNQSAFSIGDGREIYLLGTSSNVYQYGNYWRGYNTNLDGDAHVVTFSRPANTYRTRLFIDGVLDTADDITNIDDQYIANYPISVGNEGNGAGSGYFFYGNVFAVLLFKNQLNSADRIKVENYLLRKISTPTQSRSWYAQP